jgi:hypothetical protein
MADSMPGLLRNGGNFTRTWQQRSNAYGHIFAMAEIQRGPGNAEGMFMVTLT